MEINAEISRATVIKTLGKLALAFCICLALFSALKIVAVAIPGDLLHDTIARSASILEKEGGDYHCLVGEEKTTCLDNFTTAIMLKVCCSGHGSGLDAAFGDYHYSDRLLASNRQTVSLQEQLTGWIDGDDAGWASYARYWNGYVIVLKPLLLFLDLNGIRMLFVIVSSLLLFVDVGLLARLRGVFAGVAFGLPFFAVNYLVAMVSLSLSFTFFIALAGVLYVLVRAWNGSEFDCLSCAVPFFVFGALTAFFDFLCTPVVTLGLPLAVLVYVRGAQGRWRAKGVVAVLVVCVASWALGYGALWASKRVLSSLVLGWDVVGNALGQFAHRTGDAAGDAADAEMMASPLVAVAQNVHPLFPGWAVKALCAVGAVIVVAVVVRRDDLSPVNVRVVAALIAVSALPYLWYVFASNHSYVHFWFTYRAQVVSLVCLLLALEALFHPVLVRCQGMLSGGAKGKDGELLL